MREVVQGSQSFFIDKLQAIQLDHVRCVMIIAQGQVRDLEAHEHIPAL